MKVPWAHPSGNLHHPLQRGVQRQVSLKVFPFTYIFDPLFVPRLPKFLAVDQEVTGDSAFSMFNLSLREEWLNNKRFCNRLSDDEDDDIEATTEGAHNRLEAVHRKSSFIGVDSETASPSI